MINKFFTDKFVHVPQFEGCWQEWAEKFFFADRFAHQIRACWGAFFMPGFCFTDFGLKNEGSIMPKKDNYHKI